MEPQDLEFGELHEIFDFVKILNVVLAKVQLLRDGHSTCSFFRLPNSFNEFMRLTLSDTTYRLVISLSNFKSLVGSGVPRDRCPTG